MTKGTIQLKYALYGCLRFDGKPDKLNDIKEKITRGEVQDGSLTSKDLEYLSLSDLRILEKHLNLISLEDDSSLGHSGLKASEKLNRTIKAARAMQSFAWYCKLKKIPEEGTIDIEIDEGSNSSPILPDVNDPVWFVKKEEAARGLLRSRRKEDGDTDADGTIIGSWRDSTLTPTDLEHKSYAELQLITANKINATGAGRTQEQILQEAIESARAMQERASLYEDGCLLAVKRREERKNTTNSVFINTKKTEIEWKANQLRVELREQKAHAAIPVDYTDRFINKNMQNYGYGALRVWESELENYGQIKVGEAIPPLSSPTPPSTLPPHSHPRSRPSTQLPQPTGINVLEIGFSEFGFGDGAVPGEGSHRGLNIDSAYLVSPNRHIEIRRAGTDGYDSGRESIDDLMQTGNNSGPCQLAAARLAVSNDVKGVVLIDKNLFIQIYFDDDDIPSVYKNQYGTVNYEILYRDYLDDHITVKCALIVRERDNYNNHRVHFLNGTELDLVVALKDDNGVPGRGEHKVRYHHPLVAGAEVTMDPESYTWKKDREGSGHFESESINLTEIEEKYKTDFNGTATAGNGLDPNNPNKKLTVFRTGFFDGSGTIDASGNPEVKLLDDSDPLKIEYSEKKRKEKIVLPPPSLPPRDSGPAPAMNLQEKLAYLIQLRQGITSNTVGINEIFQPNGSLKPGYAGLITGVPNLGDIEYLSKYGECLASEHLNIPLRMHITEKSDTPANIHVLNSFDLTRVGGSRTEDLVISLTNAWPNAFNLPSGANGVHVFLVPINVGGHWTANILVKDLDKDECFLFLLNSTIAPNIDNRIINIFEQMLKPKVLNRYHYISMGQQHEYACGVYTVEYLKAVAKMIKEGKDINTMDENAFVNELTRITGKRRNEQWSVQDKRKEYALEVIKDRVEAEIQQETARLRQEDIEDRIFPAIFRGTGNNIKSMAIEQYTGVDGIEGASRYLIIKLAPGGAFDKVNLMTAMRQNDNDPENRIAITEVAKHIRTTDGSVRYQKAWAKKGENFIRGTVTDPEYRITVMKTDGSGKLQDDVLLLPLGNINNRTAVEDNLKSYARNLGIDLAGVAPEPPPREPQTPFSLHMKTGHFPPPPPSSPGMGPPISAGGRHP